MSTRIAMMSRRPLAAAMAFALLAPGVALAETKKEKELEARVAQLEAQVQALLSSQQQQASQITQTQSQVAQTQSQVTQTQTQLDQVRTITAAVPEGKKPIQTTSITPNALPNTTFRFGGFIKADFLSTKTYDGVLPDGAVGRYLYIPQQTPVGGKAGSVDTDFHAKFSRFNLGADSVTDNGDKITGFIEVDFFGNALATQVNNLYGSTLRHAYMTWNNWLAGQTWSNFVDANNFPEAADILGPTDGVLFGRQAQIRYTNGGLSLSAENPETLTTPYQGGSTMLASDHGSMPDLTARYTWKGAWGNFGVAGIARQFRTNTTLTNDTAYGGAVTVGGKWIVNPDNALTYQLTYGQGIARYMGLGSGPDVEIDSEGKIDTIGTLGGWVGWNHKFTPKLRTTIMYSRVDMDHDVANTGLAATRSMQSIRANLFYSPLPKVDVGAEVMYGRREIESGQSGDISRLQFTTKYSF